MSDDSGDEQEQPRSDDSERLIRGGSRVESGYPTGHVAKGSERMQSSDGQVKTRDGLKVSIPTKMGLEFVASLFLFFFGTLGSVNSSTLAVNIATTLVGTAADPTSTVENHTTIANPLSTFLAALTWSGVLFMCLRSFPGVAVNPMASLTSWFFQQTANGETLKITHYIHTLEETMLVVLSQLVGGVVAILAVFLVQGRDTSLLGETLPSALVTHVEYIILYEAAASFLFFSLITLYSRPRRDVSALEQSAFIAISLFFVVMGFGAFTGCSVNPTHTLAPAIVRSMFDHVPLRFNVVYYITGQAIGFFSAGALNWFINKSSLLARIRSATTVAKED